MPRHSSSDSEYSRSSSKRKKKSGRKRRSPSPGYDDFRRSHGKSRRRSRSRSSESERGTKRKKRSRSRDRPYSSRSRDGSRRRSGDRSLSPVRRKKHIDAVTGVSTGTMKDIMDILPGFSKMAPAEQSRIRIQRQLNAAVESSAAVDAEQQEDQEMEEEDLNYKEQIDRAKAIQAIGDDEDDIDDDGEFFPSHFRSSTKTKKKFSDVNESAKKSYGDRESSHEVAIFGHSSMLSIDEALKQKQETDDDAIFKAKRMIDFVERDPKTLMAPDFLISHEDAAARWRSKLVSLRNRFANDITAAS